MYGLFSLRDDTPVKQGYDEVYDRDAYPGDMNQVPFALGRIPSKDWSIGLKLRYRGFKLMYDRMYRADHSSLGQQTESYLYDDADALIGETIDRLAFRHENDTGRVKVRSSLSYLRYRLDPDSYFSFIFPLKDPSRFGLRNNNYKYQASDDLLWEEVAQIPLSECWALSAGLSAQYSKALPKSNDLKKPFNENDYNPYGRSDWKPDPVFGTFGQNEYSSHQTGVFGEGLYHSGRFDLQAGLRFDSNSRYGDVSTRRIAGQYKPDDDTALRLSYGEAYKAPSGYLAYNAVASADAGGGINYISIPNPDLKPEKSRTVEIGARRTFDGQFLFDIAAYATEIEDMISEGRIPLDGSLYPDAANTTANTSVNRPENTKIYGIQAVLTAQELVESIHLNSSVSLDYITGENALPAGGNTVDSILMSPEWMLKWRVSTRPFPKFQLYVDQMLCSSWRSLNITTPESYNDPFNKISGYYVMDVAANYSLTKNLILFAQIQNVWDEHYGGIDAYGSNNLRYNPQPGRSFYIGLEYRL